MKDLTKGNPTRLMLSFALPDCKKAEKYFQDRLEEQTKALSGSGCLLLNLS